jgi:hypothetical protein
MGRQFLILLSVLCLSVLNTYSREDGPDDNLRFIVNRDGQAEVTIQTRAVRSFGELTLNVSILSVRDSLVHLSLSKITVEWFISQKYDYKIVERFSPKSLFSAGSLSQALQWESYPTYTQYDSIMKSFAALYPSLCRLDTIGRSVNGKLVLALKISANPGINEDEPRVFYTSSMHGDETGGYILMLHLADYLLKNYNTSGRVKNLVDNLEIWINPLANPDGTYGTGNSITSPTRYNANGFDLNRNFPDPFTPNTVKQRETLDMISFLRKHKFSLSVNFHSGNEVVNYPWDRWLSRIHADNFWFNSISRAYADTAHVYGGPAYMNFQDDGVTRGALWYVVYGGRQDFVTWELQGREVTIELDNQYVTPPARLSLLWQSNWRSLLGYLENALYGIHGNVSDINTHKAVPARIYISGHDKDSSQVYADSITGSFVRLISPGSWNLYITSPGYQPLLINNVIVTDRQRTNLTAEMLPLVNSLKNSETDNAVKLYPNPAKNSINAILADFLTGDINIRIINQSGQILSDYNTATDSHDPLVIDIKSFAAGTYTVIFSGMNQRRYYYGKFVVIR